MQEEEKIKNFPREIIGRAVRDPGFRDYLLNHPAECLAESGYENHPQFALIVKKLNDLDKGEFKKAFEAFRSKVTTTGGPD